MTRTKRFSWGAVVSQVCEADSQEGVRMIKLIQPSDNKRRTTDEWIQHFHIPKKQRAISLEDVWQIVKEANF